MKKPLYRRWWFWVIIGVLALTLWGAILGQTDDETDQDNNDTYSEEELDRDEESDDAVSEAESTLNSAEESKAESRVLSSTPTSASSAASVTTVSSTAPTPASSAAPEPELQGQTVYRTPTGKRYHYDPDCGGKNSYPITMDQALKQHLTPCEKCVHD